MAVKDWNLIFQFYKVRLKENASRFCTISDSEFQFYKVRLKESPEGLRSKGLTISIL